MMISSICAYFQGQNLRSLFDRVCAETRLATGDDGLLLLGYRLQLAALLNCDDSVTETEYLKQCRDRAANQAMAWYFLLKAQRFYWCDRPEAAYTCLQNIKTEILSLNNPAITADYYLYNLLCLAVQTPTDLTQHYRQALQKLLCDRPQWQYKLDLVDGAICRDESALHHYEKAIAHLRPLHLNPYLALSYQLLAKHWQSQGYSQQAQVFEQQALREYQAWGAKSVVKHFQFSPENDNKGLITALNHLNQSPDLATACDRAIAFCLEFLPAQQGVIFCYQDKTWVQQTASPNTTDWPLAWLISLAETPDIAFLTASESNLPNDPYFAVNPPQKAWGCPLVSQNRCWGIFYLESQSSSLPPQPPLLQWLTQWLTQQYEGDRLRYKLKTMQERAIAQERFASLGALTAGIAHEIKNPLNFVNNFAELSTELTQELLEELEEQQDKFDSETWAYIQEIIDDLSQNLHRIERHGKRADSIIRGMLLHSRSSANDPRVSVDINALLAEYVNLAYHGMRAKDSEFNITIKSDYDPNLQPIQAVPQNLSRAFLNLINNACHATRDRTRQESQHSNSDYTPTLTVKTQDLGENIKICIRDNGTGIPPQIRQRIFEPFFTTKPTGIGTGLGLSISRDIIEKEHLGQLQIDTVVNQYTEFILILPKR
ncbi:MAG: sensor histidine kinase [Spirulinaceae cyanobacterium]